jgi:hypothetical protein
VVAVVAGLVEVVPPEVTTVQPASAKASTHITSTTANDAITAVRTRLLVPRPAGPISLGVILECLPRESLSLVPSTVKIPKRRKP